jgi:hypothetical protein
LSRHLAPARILARHTRNRIQGALLNLEITTRGRRIPSSVFIKAHWPAVAASDFFTVEAWSWTGPVTHYVLDLATRRVSLCGITTHPKEVSRPRGRPSHPAAAAIAESERVRRAHHPIGKG